MANSDSKQTNEELVVTLKDGGTLVFLKDRDVYIVKNTQGETVGDPIDSDKFLEYFLSGSV